MPKTAERSGSNDFRLAVALGCLFGLVGFLCAPLLSSGGAWLAVRLAMLVPDPKPSPDAAASPPVFARPAGQPPLLAWSVGRARTSKYDGVRVGAVARDGTLFAVSEKSVVALSPEGQERWRTKLDTEGYPDPPRLLTPRSLVVRSMRRLAALGTEGRVLWEFTAPQHTEISRLALGAEGRIVFRTGRGLVHVLGPDGRELWSHDFDPYQVSGLAVDDESHVYVGVDGRLFAFGARGEALWKHGDGKDAYRTPWAGLTVLGPDGVLYTTSAWSILAIGRDGVVRWQDVGDGKACATKGISWGDDGAVFAACHQAVSAYSREGRRQWRFQTEKAALVGAPAGDGAGTVYVASEALVPGSSYEKYGRLSALSGRTGQPSWEINVERPIHSTPLVLPDGTVLLGADNRVYAVSAEGRLLWERRLDERDSWTNPVDRLELTPLGVVGSADRAFVIPIARGPADDRWVVSGRTRTHVWRNPE